MRLAVKFGFGMGSLVLALLGGLVAASAAEPQAGPPALAAAPPCESSALALRQVRSDGPGGDALFALQNRGDTACRIGGGVGIRLFDAAGAPLALHFAPRTKMALLLTLEPGAEASFTIGFAAQSAPGCVTAARIELDFTPQLAPKNVALSAPATLTACTAGPVRVSNLQLGVPTSFRSPVD